MNPQIIDCLGMPCPQPVLRAKQALEEGAASIEVLVDNVTSRMNWRWMLSYVWGVGLTLSLVNLIWLHQG